MEIEGSRQKSFVPKNCIKYFLTVLKYECREIFLWLIFVMILVLSVMVVMPHEEFFQQELFKWQWQKNFLEWTLYTSLLYMVFLLLSAVFNRRWRSVYEGTALPECTVIVPAYNEGRHVYDTIISILSGDYPEEKLHVIAINDGSIDDTLNWLNKAGSCSSKVSIIDLKKNQGKKNALYLGMLRSKGEIIVTVDSDSIIKCDTLRQIVQPFADEKVGAVAGSIAGKNINANWHARLLDVMLVFGCEFLRRAQGASGNVFCTPGALSAYRKKAILPVIDEWLNQTFMGRPSKIGEDRAIATLLLRDGFKIVHQPRAEAETCLPDNYQGGCKMLLRWTRSDIRENILMAVFVLKRVKLFSLRSCFLFIHWFALCINMLLPMIFLPVGIYSLISGGSMIRQIAFIYIGTALWGIIPATVYIIRKKSFISAVWAFLFGYYALFTFSWITFYSLFTISNSNWLTREKKL